MLLNKSVCVCVWTNSTKNISIRSQSERTHARGGGRGGRGGFF